MGVAAELASLCPDPFKRELLRGVHRDFITSPAAQDPSLVGSGWMPPEAAMANAARMALHSPWSCRACGVVNAPDDARCEACGAGRPKQDAVAAAAAAGAGAPAGMQLRQVDDFPALGGLGSAGRPGPVAPGAAASSSSSSYPGPPAATADADDDNGFPGQAGGKSGKKGKGKQTIKIGLPSTSGGGAGAGGSSSAGASGGSSKPHPQNVWTQPAFLQRQKEPKVPNQWAGAGAGKVARAHGAVNNAWGER